jgi:dethiobiotin synthetase
MSRLFVTGSGTGIGKTLVVRLLIGALRQRDRRVRALKPIVTGFDPATAETSDTGLLLDALGLDTSVAHLERVSPWRFRAPLSPDMAARREGRAIPFADLVKTCAERDADEVTVIEGVGGVMVPIDDRHTVIDWIAAVACPTVLVTGSYLGAISHTLTALETLRRRNISVKGIIVSESIEQPVPLAETAATIERHAQGVTVVRLPRLSARTAPPDLVSALELA